MPHLSEELHSHLQFEQTHVDPYRWKTFCLQHLRCSIQSTNSLKNTSSQKQPSNFCRSWYRWVTRLMMDHICLDPLALIVWKSSKDPSIWRCIWQRTQGRKILDAIFAAAVSSRRATSNDTTLKYTINQIYQIDTGYLLKNDWKNPFHDLTMILLENKLVTHINRVF